MRSEPNTHGERLPLRLTRQVDALCDEFESRLHKEERPALGPYLARVDPAARGALLAELASLCLEQRRRAGEADPEGRLLEENPELAPELYPLLSSLALTAAHTPGGAGSTPGCRLRVRCPNCSNAIDLAPDDPLESVRCTSCGSDFSLTEDDDATKDARRLTRVGHFELIERVGMGAFGSVWKARDTELDRTVAVKIPRKGQFDAAQERAFLREARNAAQLSHPGVVPVYEVGRDGDTLYIVSEFVRGVTLADWLTGERPTPRAAAELCAQLAEALEHAHRCGVVHRDLKPGNMMLDEQGQPRLMDFGLARRDAVDATMTVDGQVLGTPGYMSPEQAQGAAHTADARSDIYSLGVVLYRLLTGRPPFMGNSRMLLHQVLHESPPRPRKLNRDIPRDLETICLRAMEKAPEKRYATAQQMADDLRRFLRHEPIKARPVGRVARGLRWVRRRPATAAALALGLLALTAGAVAIRVNHERQKLLGFRTVEMRVYDGWGAEARETDDAQVAFVKLEDATGGPILTETYFPRRSGLRGLFGVAEPGVFELPPGDFLAEVMLPDGRFHEVFRHVPTPDEGAITAPESHGFWEFTDDGRFELTAVYVPPKTDTTGMVKMPIDVASRAANPLLPEALWVDVEEATGGAERPGRRLRGTEPTAKLPEEFHYQDALVFAERTGKRLPSEAEWEYVARAWQGATAQGPPPDGAAGVASIKGLLSAQAELTTLRMGRGPRTPVPVHSFFYVVKGGDPSGEDAETAATVEGRAVVSAIDHYPNVSVRAVRSAHPRVLRSGRNR